MNTRVLAQPLASVRTTTRECNSSHTCVCQVASELYCISHLTSLSADTSVKGADKARLKDILQNGNIGSAMYIDAPSLLSKVLQGDNIDIVPVADPEVWQGGFTIVEQCYPRPRPFSQPLYVYIRIRARVYIQ